MQMIGEIGVLLRKELVLEWRLRYAISGILLYVLSTVYIVYASFVNVPAPTWNAVFWIIVLFASVNAIAKSFVQENGQRQLYYYILANPTSIVLAKVIYNTLLLFGLSLLCYGALGTVAGNPVKDQGLFALGLFLGSLGFSIAFTFISAIASKTNNSGSLMAILSFPIVIPIIMSLIKLSASALRLIQDTAIWKDILTLTAIDTMLIALSFILFPYLWRD
ncbi:MAG: heme exporter protein CcmB [Bacteroidota bacterium]